MKKSKRLLGILLALVMLFSLVPGMSLTAYAADKAIAIGETYYIGDSITFSAAPPFVYVRYDDDTSSNYVSYLTAGRTTVTTPTYATRDGQWKFDGVLMYDPWASARPLRITGPQDVTPSGFKCSGGTGTQSDPFTFEAIYPTVAVTGVTLDPTSTTLTVGNTETLTATVTPTNATNKSVTWSSSDTNVATVSNGVVTAVAPGTATITATTTDGSYTATCTVTVNAAYTVTYVVDNGSVNDRWSRGPYEAGTAYNVETCNYVAPDGKVFDCWKDSNGNTYLPGAPVVLNSNLTLTAQWKDKDEQSGGRRETVIHGDGFDIVLGGSGADNGWYDGGGYAPQRAWKVSLAPMANGTAALGIMSGESTTTDMNVYPTTSIYVFPTADPGYQLDKIIWSLIDGSASYDITEARNFVMPAMDVVVYVTFKPLGA